MPFLPHYYLSFLLTGNARIYLGPSSDKGDQWPLLIRTRNIFLTKKGVLRFWIQSLKTSFYATFSLAHTRLKKAKGHQLRKLPFKAEQDFLTHARLSPDPTAQLTGLPFQEVFSFHRCDLGDCGEHVCAMDSGTLHAIPVVNLPVASLLVYIKLRRDKGGGGGEKKQPPHNSELCNPGNDWGRCWEKRFIFKRENLCLMVREEDVGIQDSQGRSTRSRKVNLRFPTFFCVPHCRRWNIDWRLGGMPRYQGDNLALWRKHFANFSKEHFICFISSIPNHPDWQYGEIWGLGGERDPQLLKS